MGIKNNRIVCIGGANIDRKFQAFNPIHSGSSNPVMSFTSFGGVARNVAENLAYWTSNVYLISTVGNDQEGSQLLEHMTSLGVNIDNCLKLDDANTAHYYAVLKQNGELDVAYADMGIYDEVSTDAVIQKWRSLPQNSIVFIDTNFSTHLINLLIQENLNNNLKICLDPVSVAKCHKIPNRLDNVYLIKPNQAEASALTGIDVLSAEDAIRAGKELLERGVKQVVISMGHEGHVLVNQQENIIMPAIKVGKISDVNGAGDAFIAGILYGLQQHLPITKACEYGAAASAFALQTHDTVAKHITANDLNTLILSQNTKQEQLHATIF